MTSRAAPGSARSWFRARALAAVLVAAAVFLVFLPALWNGFVSYDDPTYVVDNPLIRSLDVQLLAGAFLHFQALLWIPLVWISLALDHSLWGLEPSGYHLTNVLLHACNAALVLLLAIRLQQRAARSASPASAGQHRAVLAGGTVAALLFGLHPLRVESVAWVTERKDVLSALFLLASALAYLRHAGGHGEGRGHRSRAAYLASLGLFLAALLAKPMAVSFPFVLLVLDAYPLDRIRGPRSLLPLAAEKLPFFLAAAADAWLTVLAQRSIMMSTEQTSLLARWLIAAHSLLSYLRWTVWPAGLAPFHPHPNEAILSRPAYVLSLPLVVAITVACVALARRLPAALAAWICFVVALMPVLGLVQVAAQEAADRFTYAPSVAISVGAGAGAARLVPWARSRLRQISLALGAAAGIAALSAATIRQIGFWKDGVAFWSRVISVHPDAGIAYYQRAEDHRERGDLPEALADLTTSIGIAERKGFWHRSRVYDARGTVLGEAGRTAEAVADFTRAIELSPSPDARYYRHRAIALALLGRAAEAARDHGVADAIRAGPEPDPGSRPAGARQPGAGPAGVTGSTPSAVRATGTAGR